MHRIFDFHSLQAYPEQYREQRSNCTVRSKSFSDQLCFTLLNSRAQKTAVYPCRERKDGSGDQRWIRGHIAAPEQQWCCFVLFTASCWYYRFTRFSSFLGLGDDSTAGWCSRRQLPYSVFHNMKRVRDHDMRMLHYNELLQSRHNSHVYSELNVNK